MTNGKRILIGEIATAHGIKGLVKLRSFAGDESLFGSAALYTDETSGRTISLTLKNALKGDWLAEVQGVADRNAAELLRGTKLYIERDALPETDDGEYYIEDLKGFKVTGKDGKDIGTISGIENYGASDLMDIKPRTGANFYLPFTDDIVLDVNLDDGVITVDMPEGV